MTTPQDIRDAIEQFLTELYEKKCADAQKKRHGVTDEKKLQSIENDLTPYHPSNWISQKALVFAKNLKFGSHLVKHIHSSSKGDNIYFSAQNSLPENLCASQSVPQDEYILDATGNAADLPLAKFFDIAIGQTTLKQLLLQDNPAVHGVFADNEQQSLEYCRIFQAALKAENQQPKSDERNKQLLWFCADETEENKQYQVLIPLYPVALAHCLYNKVQQRFADTVKDGEKARKENKAYSQKYATVHDLAFVKLGGANPQGVSQINSSKQRGKHFLLPSLPPQFNADKVHFSRRAKSFFVDSLLYRSQIADDLKAVVNDLKAVVESDKHKMEIRDKRKQALHSLYGKILSLADAYREQPAGWTKDYALESLSEIYWLDPNNPRFAEQIPDNWQQHIAGRFAHWLIAWLKKQFPHEKHHFNDIEYDEIFKSFQAALLFGDN
ncbi:MAG: type I-F CRISPR-associated protein Csy1 [Neisseriaceae bacterium]|nr:type I-F CRISPR-associated protein Csy1 [Neisseriaceae bacterium]